MTMENTTIGVLVSMDEDVTTKMPGVTDAFVQSRSAAREMSMGLGMLSNMALSMGIAMKASNSQTLQNMSSMMMMVGGIGSAVTNAFRFVSAMGRMTHALQAFNFQQLLANLLSGPGGWAKLLIGGALLGGAAYGISKMVSGGSSQAGQTTVINQHIAGSVITNQDVTDMAQQGLQLKVSKQGTTGVK